MFGAVGAAAEALDRLTDGESHPLLLQRQPELLAERVGHALRRDAHRREDSETCLDRHDEEVDHVRHLLVDLLHALATLELDVVRRARTSRRRLPRRRGRRAKISEPPMAGTSQRTKSENDDRAEHLVAEDLPRRRAVHPGRDELLADLRLAEPVRASCDPVAESSGERVDRPAGGRLGLRAARRLRDVAVGLDLVDRRGRAAWPSPSCRRGS